MVQNYVRSSWAGLIRETAVVIWNAAPMVNPVVAACVEHVCRFVCLSTQPFGNKVVLALYFHSTFVSCSGRGHIYSFLATVAPVPNSVDLPSHSLMPIIEGVRIIDHVFYECIYMDLHLCHLSHIIPVTTHQPKRSEAVLGLMPS